MLDSWFWSDDKKYSTKPKFRFSSLQKYKKTFPVGTRSNWLLLSVGTSILKSKERPKNCPKDVKRTSKSHLKETHSFWKTLTFGLFSFLCPLDL